MSVSSFVLWPNTMRPETIYQVAHIDVITQQAVRLGDRVWTRWPFLLSLITATAADINHCRKKGREGHWATLCHEGGGDTSTPWVESVREASSSYGHGGQDSGSSLWHEGQESRGKKYKWLTWPLREWSGFHVRGSEEVRRFRCELYQGA